MVLGLILGFGAWFIGGRIGYVPRATPTFRIGGTVLAIGQVWNFLEEVPAIQSHPIVGDAGLLPAAGIDSILSIIGFLTLVSASYFVIAEASRSRAVLAAKSVSLDTTLAEQRRRYGALRHVSEEVHARTGDAFFESLVRNIAIALEVKYAFVAECTDPTKTTVRSLAFWMNDRLGDNFTYVLESTPCEPVLTGRTCFHPEGIQALFPNDADLVKLGAQSYFGVPLRLASGEVVGHLAVLDDKPLPDPFPHRAILDIFAVRAGAELERLNDEVTVKESEARYRLVAENVSDVIWVADTDFNVTYISPSVFGFLGYTADEARNSGASYFCCAPFFWQRWTTDADVSAWVKYFAA